MKIALYQPDIAQNTGTILRLCACMNVEVEIIEPCGFIWGGMQCKRSVMDYINHVKATRHSSWQNFLINFKENNHPKGGRIILLTTKAKHGHTNFEFNENDCILLGSESSGVPIEVVESVDEKITIKMHNNEMRSLNVAIAGAIALGEALRQVR